METVLLLEIKQQKSWHLFYFS